MGRWLDRRDWAARSASGLSLASGSGLAPIWELQGVLQISLPVIFVWGLLSARLARSAVGDLVVELERPLVPGELQASLARTLGDPSLELRYALEGTDRWVDSRGRWASLPWPADGPQARTATLVEREGRPLAALIHDSALDQGLVRAAAAAAGTEPA